jgi:hypothetical protein
MKIAVFGDSYTITNVMPGNEHLGLSWVEHLALSHEVTNFGESGTAFQWSYELFLENKDKFDYCILVVADPGRVYIKALQDIPNKIKGHFFASPEHIQAFKSITTDERILKILDSIDFWYNNWRDHTFEYHLRTLMVRDLLTYDNILVIPGFPLSVEGYGEIYQNLTDIQFWELLQLDPNFNVHMMGCKRKCHLSEENNLVLFELVKQAIENKDKILKLDISKFKKPARSIDFYAE